VSASKTSRRSITRHSWQFATEPPSFPEIVQERIDDTALDVSYQLKIEIVPTLIRFEAGREVDRTYAGTAANGSG
jgi:hypothetical protein